LDYIGLYWIGFGPVWLIVTHSTVGFIDFVGYFIGIEVYARGSIPIYPIQYHDKYTRV
jgi:hypothetical protein